MLPAALSVKPSPSRATEIRATGAPWTRTVHARVAGVPSTLPATSTARTANVCVPFARPPYVAGLAHERQTPPSSEHSKPAPACEANVKVALALLTGTDDAGPPVRAVCGRTESCVHVCSMTVLLPAASVAWTRSVCVPSATAGMAGVAVHAAKAAPSTLHASAAPASAETANAGAVSLVSAPGAAVNAAAGGVRSTVHVYVADPALPAASVARTVTVWALSASPV